MVTITLTYLRGHETICVTKILPIATKSANGCENTPIATKSCYGDKKMWHKDQKLVVATTKKKGDVVTNHFFSSGS